MLNGSKKTATSHKAAVDVLILSQKEGGGFFKSIIYSNGLPTSSELSLIELFHLLLGPLFQAYSLSYRFFH